MQLWYGENGLLARAQEAIMLTKLADVLFDIESDLTAIKIDNYPDRYTTTGVISFLSENNIDKYRVHASGNTSTGLSKVHMILLNPPISNLEIGFTGDVYVDNYKRGKIQISDIYTDYLAEGRDYGDSKIKVNDAILEEDNQNFINIQYALENLGNLPWINSNNEIVAWANNFSIYPLGITDYDFASYDIAWISDFYTAFNNKYTIFPTASCKLIGNDLVVEENVFHFLKNSYIFSSLMLDSNNQYTTITIRMGGTYITSAGIWVSNTPDLEDGVLFSISDSNASRR